MASTRELASNDLSLKLFIQILMGFSPEEELICTVEQGFIYGTQQISIPQCFVMGMGLFIRYCPSRCALLDSLFSVTHYLFGCFWFVIKLELRETCTDFSVIMFDFSVF